MSKSSRWGLFVVSGVRGGKRVVAVIRATDHCDAVLSAECDLVERAAWPPVYVAEDTAEGRITAERARAAALA